MDLTFEMYIIKIEINMCSNHSICLFFIVVEKCTGSLSLLFLKASLVYSCLVSVHWADNEDKEITSGLELVASSEIAPVSHILLPEKYVW